MISTHDLFFLRLTLMYWTTFLLPTKDLLTVKLFVLDKEDSISSVEEGEFKREDPRFV